MDDLLRRISKDSGLFACAKVNREFWSDPAVALMPLAESRRQFIDLALAALTGQTPEPAGIAEDRAPASRS